MKGLALSIFLCSTLLQAACPDLNYKQLQDILHETKGPVEIVFFASWCSACKKHFVKKQNTTQIFIATFDTKDGAEAVHRKFSLPSCYFDNGIAEKLEIRSLPCLK